MTIFSRHQELQRDIDGAIDWCSLLPILRRGFDIEGAGIFSDSQWLSIILRGSNKPRFQYFLDLNENLMYVRAIQGHSGEAMVYPDMLNDVAIPFGWKEYLCHVEGSFTLHSNMQAVLIAVGKDTKEGRQSVFFTALDPLSDEPDEEYEDSTKPRKVHYKNKWRVTQGINLRKA